MLRERIVSFKTNLLLDLLLFAGFLVAFEVRLTGVALHEWLSLAVAGSILLHLLFHWRWIVAVTRRFLHRLVHETRLNYVVDAIFFISFTVTIFSGLLISRAVLPTFGIALAEGFSWRFIHAQAANLSVLMVAVHVGLHWRWILDTTRRLTIVPLQRALSRVLPQQPRAGLEG